MISHTQNITTANTTARIFELKEEKDFGGNEIPHCYLVDFLDAEGDELLNTAIEFATLEEARAYCEEALDGLVAG